MKKYLVLTLVISILTGIILPLALGDGAGLEI
jgi:hypothetical protein